MSKTAVIAVTLIVLKGKTKFHKEFDKSLPWFKQPKPAHS